MLSKTNHPFINRTKKIKIKHSKHVTFQCLTLFGQDEEEDEGTRYNVHIFGVNKKGQSLHVKVEEFKPYCYVRPPPFFTRKHLDPFITFFEKNMRQHATNIVDIEMVTKTGYDGYQEPSTFIKITFHTKKAMSYCKYMFLDTNKVDPESDGEDSDGEEKKPTYYNTKKLITIEGVNKKPFYYKLYETHIDPILRFIHNSEIKACGWVSILPNTFSIESPAMMASRTQISLITTFEHIHPYENDDVAPFMVLSYDLECTSIDGAFPQATRPGDQIIQCGFTAHIVGEDNSKPLKYINTLGGCDDIEGAIVRSFETEKELLEDIINVFVLFDPDVITGYNINQFDFKYLLDRCNLHNLNIIGKLSRYKNNPATIYKKIRESSALGYNKMYLLNAEGRVVMDLYKIFQSEKKLANYKLDAVAEKYLGLHKDDVTPNQIFEFQKGTDSQRAIIAKYCIQDCWLCNKLMDKMCFFINSVGMANTCSTPLQYLFVRGQGIKGTSLVGQFAQKDGIVFPMLLKNNKHLKWKNMTEQERNDMKKVQGAIVIKANKGLHYFPVEVNDYGSLYPSSMISHNLSFDTLITKKSPPVPEEQIEHRKWMDEDGNEEHYMFKKADEEPDKWKKENWPEFKTPEEEKVFMKEYTHYQEVERKGRGILPKLLIALLDARKKAKARKSEEKKKGNSFLAQVFDGYQLAIKISANSIYGLNGTLTSDLCCKPVAASTTMTGRELLMFSDKISKEVVPGCELIYGDSVSGDTPITIKNVDGSISVTTIEELSNTWTSYDQFKAGESNRKEKQQSIIDAKVWTHKGWSKIKRVIRHKTVKKKYRILTHTGCIDVTEDHSLLSSNCEILKSKDVSIGDDLLHSFPLIPGIIDQRVIKRSYKKENKTNIKHDHTTTSKVSAQRCYLQQKLVNNSVVLDIEDDKYIIKHVPYFTYPHKIKKIIELPPTTEDEFVYDLETEEGVFHAGIGELIVKNTDSIMVKYPIKGFDSTRRDYTEIEKQGFVRQSMASGIIVEKAVSKLLPWPHCLEREKTFYPFLLFSKKRYVAIKYEDPEKPEVIHSGVVSTRRDNANIVKMIINPTFDIILYEMNVEKAVNYVQEQVQLMLNKEKFVLDDFKISVALKKVKKVKQAQHILAERITRRDPGNAPQMNDRMFYIYIKLTKKQEQMIIAEQNSSTKHTTKLITHKNISKPKIKTNIDAGYKIETPEYIRENNIPIDYYHYLTNQLIKPIIDLFKTEFDDAEEHIFGKIKNDYFLKSNNMQQITDFFS